MNHYQVLGVNDTDSLDDIKRAWKKLAKQYHPDVCKQHDATIKLQQINAAFQWIKKNHKQIEVPRQKTTARPKQPTVVKLTRHLSLNNCVTVPQWQLDVIDIVVTVIIEHSSQFKCHLTRSTKLPHKVTIRNQYGQIYPILFVDELPECMSL